jgi:hypothetical protein
LQLRGKYGSGTFAIRLDQASQLGGRKGYPAKYRFFQFFRFLPQQTDALPVFGLLPVSFQNIVQAHLQRDNLVMEYAFVGIVDEGNLVNDR